MQPKAKVFQATTGSNSYFDLSLFSREVLVRMAFLKRQSPKFAFLIYVKGDAKSTLATQCGLCKQGL
jgi:hypothetical protein